MDTTTPKQPQTQTLGNQQPQTQGTGIAPASTPTPNPVANLKTPYAVRVQCAIRRKLSLIGLPGADPAERMYKLGSCLNIRTSKNLKGIEDKLEKMLMPSVIGVNATDNSFQNEINEYWGNIGVLIPADEAHLRDDEKGKVIKFVVIVKGSVIKELIEGETDIEKKMAIINKAIEEGNAELESESYIPDFLLINFALKNKEVAKDIRLAGASPRIKYYIFNKNTAVKQRMNIIELKAKAIDLFTTVQTDDKKIDALIVMFGLLPTDYDTTMDKIIALDAEYSKSPETMQRFIDYASDENLETKYLIKLAVKKGKVTNYSNTETYYYNQVLLGKSLTEAVLFLLEDNVDSKSIKATLEREIKD